MRLAFWRRERVEQKKINLRDFFDSVSIIKVRLERRVRDIEAKERELFEQVVKAYMERNQERAAIYAEELAELRRALKKLVRANMLLDSMLCRIETVKDLQDASRVALPLKKILVMVSQETRGIAPAASSELDKLVNLVEDLTVGLGGFNEPVIIGPCLSDEAKKILEEASMIAAQRRSEKSFG